MNAGAGRFGSAGSIAMAMVTGIRQPQELTAEQGRVLLEERVRRPLRIDLPEFIRRWQAGCYGDPDDNPDALELAVLLPIVGVDPLQDGRDAEGARRRC